MLPPDPLPLGPAAGKPRGAPGVSWAVAAIVIGLAGAFGWPARWNGLLALPFGPDGVRPLQQALSWSFLFVATAGFVRLLRLRPPPPGYETIRGIQLAWLRLRVAVMLLLLALAATVATRMWLHLGARAAWRAEWWGADETVRTALWIFGGLTLFASLSLLSRIRELRSPLPPADGPSGGEVSNPAGSVSRPR